MKISGVLVLLSVGMLIISSCRQNKSSVNKSAIDKELEVAFDSSNQMIKFGNTLFSLPSPYQLSILIKQIGSPLNTELLNSTNNYTKYTSLFKKSVNLGVYGADLAYLNIYEQSPSVISCFSVIKIMATDLGLTSAFSPSLFERIENNIDNKDSLLFIMSNTYRDVDIYLKENDREREGALVLAGGWVEAMYLLTQLSAETKNETLITRVGESKQPLENLIKILSPYYNESTDIKDIIDDLIELANEFDGVANQYAFKQPETKADLRLTKIHSETKVIVLPEVLGKITQKVASIRELIIK
jgi:hypothetical protein